MSDDKLATDEARRAVQHEQIKSRVEREVGSEVAARAERAPDGDKVGHVAAELRGKALKEVVSTEREVTQARGAARVSQFVDYAFYLAYGLLGIRLVLALMAANSASGFVRFIRGVTDPLYLPFRGIVASPTDAEGHTLVLPLLLAIGAYALLHAAINGMFRLVAHRKTKSDVGGGSSRSLATRRGLRARSGSPAPPAAAALVCGTRPGGAGRIATGLPGRQRRGHSGSAACAARVLPTSDTTPPHVRRPQLVRPAIPRGDFHRPATGICYTRHVFAYPGLSPGRCGSASRAIP